MHNHKMILCLLALFTHLLLGPGHAANAEIPYYTGMSDYGAVFIEGDFSYDRISLADYTNDDIIASGSIMLSYHGHEQDVVVPATLGGMDVVAVEGLGNNGDIKNVTLPKSIVMIGHYAFSYAYNLESVYLSESLRFIGHRAFHNCQNLKTIDLPYGLEGIGFEAFTNCINLESINLPGTLKYLGSDAFYNCSSLTSVVLPESLEEISGNNNPFIRCPAEISVAENHPSLYVENGVLFDKKKNMLITYPYDSPFREYSVPEGITIGPSAFYHVKNLSLLKIPADMTQTETNLFVGMSAEFEVSPQNPALYVRDGALFGKAENKLITYPINGETSYTIPEGTLAIGEMAFRKSSQLENVLFPSSLLHIGANAFRDCSGINEIILPDQITKIGKSAFYRCTSLKKAVLPKDLETLEDFTFFRCENLEEIILPDGLESIEYAALAMCESLKEIVMPQGLTFIDPSAFRHGIKEDPPVLIVTKGSYAEKWAKENKAVYRYTQRVDSGDQNNVNSVTSTELRVGSKGQEVLDMKQRLYELGYFRTNQFNNRFTDSTADTVRLFEENNGLKVDGNADADMLNVLFSDSAVGK